MIFAAPAERRDGETRVPLIPATVEKLVALGAEVRIEEGIGRTSNYSDSDYVEKGATIETSRVELLGGSDVVLRLNKPPMDEIAQLKEGAVHLSFLDPFNEAELVERLAQRNIQAVAMDLIPRSTRAQKMDALSSQASLAGYVAVILSADRLHSAFPMMSTPAGTIYPARVFIIGAGVAGLQAIATAKRLGARVEAFDTRPEVEEQVHSLGARFVKLDLGDQGEARSGYARELTAEELEQQRELMASHCAAADVVITTAQVPGRKAPLIVTTEMIRAMKPGSVIVDMAVDSGGNVAGSVSEADVDIGGVVILGYTNLARRVPIHASQVYSNNLLGFISEFWDSDAKKVVLNLDDEIVAGCLVTNGGEVIHSRLRDFYS